MKNKSINNNGITLISLVITIIVLMILAGVSIALLAGENGILNKTTKAKTETEVSQLKEQMRLDILGIQANNNREVSWEDLIEIAQKYGGEIKDNNIIIGENKINISDIYNGKITFKISEAKKRGKFEITTTVVDDDGNKIMVPEGFKIATDSGNSVQEGIVIEDVTTSDLQGSQYVWVPIGTVIKNDKSRVDITLGRYDFDAKSGDSILIQSAAEFENETPYKFGKSYDFIELKDYQKGTTSQVGTAFNLKKFIESSTSSKGFYIARYEASYAAGTNWDNYTCASRTTDAVMPYHKAPEPGQLLNNVYQNEASKIAINTYLNSNIIESDLINSYAWDTTLVYIQKMGNEKYPIQNKHYSQQTQGAGKPVEDVECKIYNLSSNMSEWTTEYNTSPYRPDVSPHYGNGVLRDSGIGAYYHSPSERNSGGLDGNITGFRLIFYFK